MKEIVIQNKDILQSLRINFDRPDAMKELYKKLESKNLILKKTQSTSRQPASNPLAEKKIS